MSPYSGEWDFHLARPRRARQCRMGEPRLDGIHAGRNRRRPQRSNRQHRRSRRLLDRVRDRHRPGRRLVRDVALYPVPRRPVEHRPEPDTDAVAGLDCLSGGDTRYHGALGRPPESIFGCDECARRDECRRRLRWPIDPSTITTSTVRLRAQGAGADVPATVTYDDSTAIATLDPSADLASNTLFTVTIAASVADNSGNQLGTPVTWSFRTAAATGSFTDTTGANSALESRHQTHMSPPSSEARSSSTPPSARILGTSSPYGWSAKSTPGPLGAPRSPVACYRQWALAAYQHHYFGRAIHRVRCNVRRCHVPTRWVRRRSDFRRSMGHR